MISCSMVMDGGSGLFSRSRLLRVSLGRRMSNMIPWVVVEDPSARITCPRKMILSYSRSTRTLQRRLGEGFNENQPEGCASAKMFVHPDVSRRKLKAYVLLTDESVMDRRFCWNKPGHY